MAGVLLLTHGTNGDVSPFVALGRELSRRGHRVTLITHARYAAQARAAGLTHLPVDTEESYDRHLRATREFLLEPLRDPAGLLRLHERSGLFDQIRREVRMILDHYRPGSTVVVARHTSGIAGLLAAELCGVPVAVAAVSPSQYLSLPVTEQVHRRVLGPRLNEIRMELGLPPMRDWRSWFAAPRLHLGLWPDWFDAAGPPTPDYVVRCGFVLDDAAESGELPAAAARPLTGPLAPVLITSGTGQVLHDRFIGVAARACHLLGRPALLVTRHRSLLPEHLPDGVHWVPAAPFADLMPRVAVVVHHGGIGTLARALAAGVPQILLAHAVDRPDNAERLRRVGAASWLPAGRWDEAGVAALISEALADTGYAARVAELSATVDSAAAAARAADRIQALAGTDGPLLPPPPDRPGLRERLDALSAADRRRLAAALRARRRG